MTANNENSGSAMNDLQNMAIFNEIVETGSFSKAAKSLDIAKSSVSKRINALEKSLNVILVQRSTRQLKITDEGWALYKHSKQIMQNLAQARDIASNLSEAPQGTLRISAPPLFGRIEVAPLLPKFQRLYPNVSIEFHLTEKYSEIIGEGFDISLRMGKLPDSTLTMLPLTTFDVACCASPQYLKTHGTPENLSELESHDCIVWRSDDNPKADLWELQRNKLVENVRVRSKIITNDHSSIKRILLNNGGISALPIYIIKDELKSGELTKILSSYKQPSFPINILYPQRKNIPAKTSAFISFLKDHIS